MRAVVQKVSSSKVTVDGEVIGQINQGLLVLLGVTHDDTSKDVDLFGKYIAKILNIKVRFVGEEPIDMVTRQYNRSMQERLPLYGIEVMEIKRKEMGAQVISASRVRKCLENKDFEGIRELVPETTYEYLVKKYS